MDQRYIDFIIKNDACSEGREEFVRFATVDDFLRGSTEVDHSMWLLLVSGLPLSDVVAAGANLLERVTRPIDAPRLRDRIAKMQVGAGCDLSALLDVLITMPHDHFPAGAPTGYGPAQTATDRLTELMRDLHAQRWGRLYVANRAGAYFTMHVKQCVVDLKLRELGTETLRLEQLSYILTSTVADGQVAAAIDRATGYEPAESTTLTEPTPPVAEPAPMTVPLACA